MVASVNRQNVTRTATQAQQNSASKTQTAPLQRKTQTSFKLANLKGIKKAPIVKQNDPIGKATVTAGSLNVRSGPGTNYARIGGVSKGRVLDVYEEKDGWIRVLYGTNAQAWVCMQYTDYVSQNPGTTDPTPVPDPDPTPTPDPTPEPEPEPTPTPENKQVITTTGLNMRNVPGNGKTPANGSTVYLTIPEGTVLDVLAEQNGWYQVSYGGYTGWVCGDYTQNYTKPNTDGSAGQKAVDYAYTFKDRITHDLVGTIPHLEDLSWVSGSNNGYDLNCANFACAILQNYNLISGHTNSVSGLKDKCTSQGYRATTLANAKPGDIWCSSGHAELVYSNTGSKVTLIGSNNGGTNVQRVTTDAWSPYNVDANLYTIQ